MYRIGEFSKLGRVTVKALRYYDEIGLLKPSSVDEWTGYRYYASSQLYQLHEIVALKQLGFSIEQISAILADAAPASLVADRLAELEAQQRSVIDQLFRVRHYLKIKEEGYEMEYKVVVKEIPGCTVFSARRKVADYTEMMSLIPAVGAQVAADNPGVGCVEPEYCCNVCHDTEYRDQDMDIEICQAVTGPGQDGDGYEFKQLPPVTVASVLHRGPYEDLGAAYAYLVDWVETNGYRIAGDWREAFIDGVWNKDSAQDWLTEVQMPIAAA
ncbi:MAG: MerR family transcriptional regulator [Propionibacteriaceae bacterium]|jgi:DNA-binding transcriptional MerR regulator/effector-binding domain-containing protein|nr:MerR family transcriptional regulator [Propionibacteriaceae bacterium]